MQGAEGSFAYVIRPSDTVERRDVKVASIEDGVAAVDSGIAAGERVVVDGQYRLSGNAKVRVEPAR